MLKILMVLVIGFWWWFYTVEDRDLVKHNREIKSFITQKVNEAKSEVKQMMSDEEKENKELLW